MPLRETRRFKTRGFVISFGDIMLPLVGIVAVGLLLVAGKLFFLSGVQSERRDLPVIPASPVVSGQEKPARAEELPFSRPESRDNELRAVFASADTSVERKPPGMPLNVLAVPYDSGNASAVKAVPTEAKSGSTVKVTVVPAEAQKQKPSAKAVVPQKVVPKKNTAASGTIKTTTKTTTTTTQTTTASAPAAPAKAVWRVQVGAFSTRAAADSVTQQLGKAGYSASIISGKKLFRVLIQAGSTRNEALALATKMGRANFPGAFIVPPSS